MVCLAVVRLAALPQNRARVAARGELIFGRRKRRWGEVEQSMEVSNELPKIGVRGLG